MPDTAKARNQQLILALGALTILAVFASSHLLEQQPMHSGGRLALALLPLPFSLIMLALYVRLVRQADEFQRKIFLESLAIAWPAAMILGMTFEYLQKAGFAMWMDVGRLWPLMMLLWVPALFYSYWRYR
ncbi:MAG: hypothetical protein ACR2L6_02180 [Gemmatimonadaceae bacterium]